MMMWQNVYPSDILICGIQRSRLVSIMIEQMEKKGSILMNHTKLFISFAVVRIYFKKSVCNLLIEKSIFIHIH